MNTRLRHTLAALALGAGGLQPALATVLPCSTTLVSDLANTSCLLGDLQLHFGSATVSGPTTRGTDYFRFVPSTGLPNEPAFAILPRDNMVLAQPDSMVQYTLPFQVVAPASTPAVAGLQVALNAITTGGTPNPQGAGGGTVVDAWFEALGLALTPHVFPEACVQSGGGFSACTAADGAGLSVDLGHFSNGPVSAFSGTAGWMLMTDGTGMAEFVGAGYGLLLDTGSVPEPAGLSLLALAGLGLWGTRRGRRWPAQAAGFSSAPRTA